MSSQLGLTFQEAVSDSKQWGQFFESAIGAYILSEAFTHRFEVFYWREGNDEVDFILKKNKKFIAIEVKSNGEAYTTGLERFRNLFHPSAIFIVGEKGISPEVFLNMDLRKLFE